MNKQRILEELLNLLESNGTVMRTEPLGGSGGGLCTIKGRRLFFVDSQACSAEVAAQAARAVLKVADIDNIYIKPEVRQFIESQSEKK
jgi:hypothetical protein